MGILVLIPLYVTANAEPHPNLIVSAENPAFGNHFSGSMVVEVIIHDPGLSDTSVGKGEPDVTINGNNLRMVQTTDGRWYGYFANVDKAKTADQIAFDGGVSGVGLDFGVFCSKDTISLGPTFSETSGIAIPRSTTGATNGNSAFVTCTGTLSGTNLNNVVRSPKSINTNPNILPGQIGLNATAWPLVQLFSFSNNVVIQYNGVGTQSVTLAYDDIPNVSLSLDKKNYPPGAHVFATINDIQLNQDPTSRDSWTFNVDSSQTVFYDAFTESGASSANGGAGLVNLIPKLSSLGFEKNGKLAMNLGTVAELKQNDFQQSTASDGTVTYSKIVTFVETEPNSGIFENADHNSQSNIKILSSAPRGQSATIEYNSKSYSIVSGLNTASISLGATQVLSGQRIPLTVVDSDQNINPASRDKLDVFRSSALIPSLTIGSPATLENAASVKFYASTADNLSAGTSITSTVPDRNSDRLVLDTTTPASLSFEKISLNLGITADDLKTLLIDTSSANNGTNWINYDLRSIQNQLGITDFSDTRISLFFGLTDSSPVTLLSIGRLTGAQGFIQNDTAATLINSKSGQAFLVIDFDASHNSSPPGAISSEADTQPIVFDLFSFGEKNGNQVNNAIYRFELKETGLNTDTFTGTLEYVIANQLNQFDSNTIKTLSTTSDNVKFFVNQRLINEKGINIAYSDTAKVGLTVSTSAKTDISTHSGTVALNSKTYRFGQPVTIRLDDPDLNIKHDTIDIYSVINDSTSSDVDTVGSSSGTMLEVLIKDIRYKRCTINGVTTGGLASTGFSLVETGPNTGVFEGVFKMPSNICNQGGTGLISSAGGIIDIKYTDFRDAFGQQNIFKLSKQPKQDSKLISKQQNPTLNSKTFSLPSYGKTSDVVMSGKINNYKSGTKIKFTLVGPDGKQSILDVVATKQGNYKTIILLKHDSLPGKYNVNVNYLKSDVGKASFDVSPKTKTIKK